MAMSTQRIRAAEYARMSTERQDFSLEFQHTANAAYAEERGYDIVRAYSDSGVSGLTMERRAGLKSLVSDIIGGGADYQVVLVYDVSRWGRFQDPDQAAHYEFICREAGIAVEYSAEPFQQAAGLSGAILKTLKRAMAAEYSRELSTKCSQARRTAAIAGYWPGGAVGYGYRRQIELRSGKVLGVLAAGDIKPIGTRTRIVLGPLSEQMMVRRIYRLFIRSKLPIQTIAKRLNREGVPSETGRQWSDCMVRSILTRQQYAGRPVFNRYHSPLGETRTHRAPPDKWLSIRSGSPAIVSERTWRAAQIEWTRRQGPSRQEMLDHLRRIADRHGYFANPLLRGARGFSEERYRAVFGCTLKAAFEAGCRLTSYQQSMLRAQKPQDGVCRAVLSAQKEELVTHLRRTLLQHGRLTARLINADRSYPRSETIQRVFGDLAAAYVLAGYVPSRNQSINMLTKGVDRLSLAEAREIDTNRYRRAGSP